MPLLRPPALLITALIALLAAPALTAEPSSAPAWQLPVNTVLSAKPVSEFPAGMKWDAGVWPKSSASVVPGKSILRYQTYINSTAPQATYVTGTLPAARDWSGYDGIRLKLTAACTSGKTPIVLRLIINEETKIKIAALPMKSGDTRTFTLPFPNKAKDTLNAVECLKLLWVSREFIDGDKLWLQISDFELVKLASGVAELPAQEVGLELFIGPGGSVDIIDDGQAPAGRVAVYTGSRCRLDAEDRVTYIFTHLFSGRKTVRTQAIGRAVAGGERVEMPCDFAACEPGYYWVTADIQQDAKSLAGGRVGFADFHVRAPNEPMAYSILSIRAGMGRYIIDPIGGYGSGSVALMHTYDPRDADHYIDFIKAYQARRPHGASTSKDTEVMEAGVTGTVFAAYAFRAAERTANNGFVVSGNPFPETRSARQYAEWLLKNNCDYLIDYMQNPDGSTKWDVNEYFSRNLGDYSDSFTEYRVPDTNQIGEWLRAISRTIIYFKDDPPQGEYVERLYKAARKSADFLVRSTTDKAGGYEHVIRHFKLLDGKYPGGRRLLYVEGGRQCDVYAPRAMAGLSYFAYACHLLGRDIPPSYLDALRDTTKWSLAKMKPDTGWYDWQCSYEAEGGCHAFLGNQYLAEAAQGYYLLCAARGDAADAKLAAECTRRALRFVTDHDRSFCHYTGNSPQEFWVGPYLYWQFSEYLGSIGEEPRFREYLGYLHKGWAEKRNWRDFTQRTGDGPVSRSNELSHITMSILAYPALRLMEEQGHPFKYPVPTLAELESAKP